MCRQHYGACERCTAKWFSPEPVSHCPRCGSPDILDTQAVPPWRLPRWATATEQDCNAKSRAEGGVRR